MGEKYLLKKELVHWFHEVMLFSGSEHNQSHAFPLREKGKVAFDVLCGYMILSQCVGQLD